MLLVDQRLQLVYRGHNNHFIWYTSKRSTGRDWFWDTPRYIPDTTTVYAPTATMHRWGGPTAEVLTVAYVGDANASEGENRIYYRHINGYQGESSPEHVRWSEEFVLPEEIRINSAPSIISSFHDGRESDYPTLFIFYRGFGEENQIYVTRKEINRPGDTGWSLPLELPRAFTRIETGEVYTGVRPAGGVAVVNYHGSIVVAYVGHNNDYIWLRKSSDGEDWDRLGYIRNTVTDEPVATRRNPTLAVVGDTLYMAFKAVDSHEVCVGTLELEDGRRDALGHRWTCIRNDMPRLNCGPS
jgi:hypothetical protein